MLQCQHQCPNLLILFSFMYNALMSMPLLDAYSMFTFVFDASMLVSLLDVYFMSTFVFDVSMLGHC
jgi:hypothetical protein